MARSDNEQQSEAQRVSRALAEAAVEAESLKLDETEPGGVYDVNGVKVNANGEPVKERRAGADEPKSDEPKKD